MNRLLHVGIHNSMQSVTNQTVDFGGGRLREMLVVHGFSHMIRDSVMNGIYYPAEAFDALANDLMTSEAEIHAPASHPVDKDGNFVSAMEPRAMAYNVGAYHFNWRVDGDRLLSDMAIDPERANNSGEGREILRRINGREPIDGSTGFYLDITNKTGVGPDGEAYQYEASNLEMDHSAILVLEEGAKTNADGVGIFANRDGRQQLKVITCAVNAIAANLELPVAGLDHPWDADAAVNRLREYTNSQDQPSSNYRKFFGYFDAENTSKFDAYRLPFADIIDGRPYAIPRAINAISSAISGVGAGTGVPHGAQIDTQRLVDHYRERMKSINGNSRLSQAVNSFLHALGFDGYNSANNGKSDKAKAMSMKEKLMGMMKKRMGNEYDEEKVKNMSEEDMLNMLDKYMGSARKNEDDDMDDKSGDEDKSKKANSQDAANDGDQDNSGGDSAVTAALSTLTETVKGLTEKVGGLDTKINRVESRMANGDEQKRSELLKHIPGMNSKIAEKLSLEDLESMAAEHGYVAINAAGGSPESAAKNNCAALELPNFELAGGEK